MRSYVQKFCLPGLLGLLFPLLFIGCQWVRDIFPSAEKPQILSVQIPGIPDANISVDQDKVTVTVLLPDTLVSLTVTPNITLSKGSKLSGNIPSLNLATYCPCALNSVINPSSILNLPIHLERGSNTNTYILALKSQAPFRFRPFKAPVEWDYLNETVINLPVANYYGASFVLFTTLTKIGSGKSIGVGGEGCLDVCPGRLNQIGIPLGGLTDKDSTGGGIYYLPPGLYDLDVSLADGTKAHAPGAILVK